MASRRLCCSHTHARTGHTVHCRYRCLSRVGLREPVCVPTDVCRCIITPACSHLLARQMFSGCMHLVHAPCVSPHSVVQQTVCNCTGPHGLYPVWPSICERGPHALNCADPHGLSSICERAGSARASGTLSWSWRRTLWGLCRRCCVPRAACHVTSRCWRTCSKSGTARTARHPSRSWLHWSPSALRCVASPLRTNLQAGPS